MNDPIPHNRPDENNRAIFFSCQTANVKDKIGKDL